MGEESRCPEELEVGQRVRIKGLEQQREVPAAPGMGGFCAKPHHRGKAETLRVVLSLAVVSDLFRLESPSPSAERAQHTEGFYSQEGFGASVAL